MTVPRVDLLIDIGKSINPGVDMGQITGGFIQGMGWVTAEALIYNEQGELLSHSPTTYKIPAITDVPPIFNCEFFPNDDNIHNIRRSKAVGEPPLLLGVAVWAAVKHALSFLPREVDPQLSLPATGEEILRCMMASQAAKSPILTAINAERQLNPVTKQTTFIETLAALAETGQPFVQVTLVEATGSTPQDSGSKMLVTENGLALWHGRWRQSRTESHRVSRNDDRRPGK